MFIRSVLGLFAATLFLTGCGGGDSNSSAYSGPTAPVAVTTTTEGDAVASYAKSAALSSSFSNLADTFVPLTGNTSPELSAAPDMLGNLAKRFADMALKPTISGTSLMAGVTASQTYSCGTSGTYTLTVNVADPYATNPSPGDSYTFSFNNCVYGSFMDTGSVTFTVNTYTTGNDFSATYTFSNYTTTVISSGDFIKTVGAFTAAISAATDTTYSITGTSLVNTGSFSGVAAQLRYSDFSFVDIFYTNFDLSLDHDFTIASTEIGGSITVNTVTPFVIANGDIYPYVGQLIVTAASNAKVRLTAEDNVNVTIEYDLDGDDIYETTLNEIAWTSL